MKSVTGNQTRKRAVNLTLNEDLITQVKGMTGNLSGVVEELLADYVQKQIKAKQERAQNAMLIAQTWNNFNEQCGSFADEYSTL